MLVMCLFSTYLILGRMKSLNSLTIKFNFPVLEKGDVVARHLHKSEYILKLGNILWTILRHGMKVLMLVGLAGSFMHSSYPYVFKYSANKHHFIFIKQTPMKLSVNLLYCNKCFVCGFSDFLRK